jgi:hypothetical protein
MIAADRPSRILGDDAGLRVSFEFFPPKTEAMEETLWQSIERLKPLSPSFVSVTYGAGGSTRERTHATLQRILAETSLRPAAHLTCVAATRDEVNGVVDAYREVGIRHIVALRGDPVGGAGTRYEPQPGGYPTLPISSPALRSTAISRFPSPPTRRSTLRAPRSPTTSRCSGARSTPAHRGRSPSSSSTTTATRPTSTACAPPA